MDKSLSVIIPAFNAERYLKEAVDSVRAQGHDSLEIIVVDDGSTDGTRALAERLPGVKCVAQQNAGAAGARNAGVEAATGEYLAFLDADDLWPAGKLCAQWTALQNHPDVQLVAGHVQEFYAQGVAPLTARNGNHLGHRAYTAGALLIRRADFLHVGLFNPALRFGEFMDWHSRAMAKGIKELVLGQVVLLRRIHDTNTTRLSGDHQRHYLATVRAHLQRKRSPTPEATSRPPQPPAEGA